MDSEEGPKNLSDKMFIFLKETSSDHVKLTLDQENFTALTVCQRFFTDLKRNHAVFSMATPDHKYAFLTYIYKNDQKIGASVKNEEVKFEDVDLPIYKWHSICTTWDSEAGVVQVWLNGQHLTTKYITEGPLTGKPIITLGQEQENYGGGFMWQRSFVGNITDVHVWDYVLLPHEIEKYMKNKNFPPGNVLNWDKLKYEIKGKVVVQERPNICLCEKVH